MPDQGVDTHRRALPFIEVNRQPLTAKVAAALSEVRVEQSIHASDSFTLRFYDPEFSLVDGTLFQLAGEVKIGVDTDGVVTPLMIGEITGLTADLDAMDQLQFVVTGLDRRHRLARGVKIRTFAQQTDSDVVKTVAGAQGLSVKADATTINYEYLLQCGTDFDFIDERARVNGFDWWVDDRTLHFKKPAKPKAAATATWGQTLRRFRLRVSAAESAGDAVVRGWDPTSQKVLTGKTSMKGASGAGVALATDAGLVRSGVARVNSSFPAERLSWGAAVGDQKEAAALATALARRATAEQAVARGETIGDAALRPGVAIEIKGLATSLSGTYQLSRVEHVLTTSRSYVTRFEAGGGADHTLVDLLGGGHDTAAGAAPPLLGSSLVIGVITNNADPDKLGRVKVKFPSLDETLESTWARVVSTGAGSKRGLQVIPDVNDEVLVGFEHGDVRRPLVLGGLWSSKNAHPVHAANGKDGAVWQTKSGHLMTMSDGQSPAESFIRIGLKTGKTTLMLGEDGSSLEVEKDLSVDGKGKVTVKAVGDVSVEGMNITVKAKSKLVLEGQAGVDIKSNGPVNVEGAAASVKGKVTATLEGTTLAEVKGAMVKVG